METPQNAPSRGTSAQDESLIVRDGPTAPASGEEAPNLAARRPTVERSGRAAQSGNYFGATMLAKAAALLIISDRCRRRDSSTGIPW